MRRYVLEDVQSEDRSENGMWFLVEIFYKHTVVGGVVNHTGVIYGARIQRTVALRMRTDAYIIVQLIGAEKIGMRHFWF